MCSKREARPDRPDLPLVKGAFESIFKVNTKHREIMKQHMNIDVDDLAERCWQACEAGDKKAILRHRKELLRGWNEQKRIVDGLLEQIELMSLDQPSTKTKKTSNPRKGKTAAVLR